MNRYKQVLRKFIARNFYLFIDGFHKLKFFFMKLNDPLVIILTPGKVGSSSVYKTLKKEFKSVFHLHNFTEKSIERSISINKKSSRRYVPLHLINSKYLLRKVKKNNLMIHLICLIREPINREISSVYQNIEMFENSTSNSFLKINNDVVLSKLTDVLSNDKYLMDLENWFNEQLFENLGIDIYKFDLAKGYEIQCFKNVKFLLIRMEDLDRFFSKSISEFIPLSNTNINLKRSNISSNKFYNSYYKELKQNLKIEKYKIYDHYVKNKFVKKFY